MTESEPIFKVLRNAEIYGPEQLGVQDILIAGKIIGEVSPNMNPSDIGRVEEVDLSGRLLVPGFIDYHNHFLGGGGGGGFPSRVPPLTLSKLTMAGITTVVGCLGFDATTKGMEGLLAHAHSLEAEGLTSYVYSGATLEHPVPTLTGRIRTDLVFVEKVIGVGEVSLSELGPSLDSAGPGAAYIAAVATEAYLAGGLAGKAGIVCLQVPIIKKGLTPLTEMLEETGLPIQQFVPAHANAAGWYLDQISAFARMGGTADVTSSYGPGDAMPDAIKPSIAIDQLLKSDVPLGNITMTSDGNGGFPVYDDGGGYLRTHYLSVDTLHAEMIDLVHQHGWKLEDALSIITANPARVLGMEEQKGHVRKGCDADFVVLNADLSIDQVWAKGQLMCMDGQPIVRGLWEA